jgi:hypothetical protein
LRELRQALNTESIRIICDIEAIFDIRSFVFGESFVANKKRVLSCILNSVVHVFYVSKYFDS